MNATALLSAALADRYRIERELGAGGMATVYLAQDLKHDRKVAIKVMRPEVSAELAADRFLREIRTTANLQHPHIVPVFDSGSAEGQLYFVMPLIEGETLRQRLEREGPLPVDEAIRLVRELADALQYAHEAGILHRDLKPENVMLSRGHAMLADFGIARSAESDGDDRLTRTGSSVGTPAYMSPEQATGERELRPSSDVYGLGAILFELLTGQRPFTGATAQAILVKQFTSEAPLVRTLRGDAPAGCETAVARALASDPDQRFATAAAFAAALAGAGAMPSARESPHRSERSLVVLPFVNQSPDPDNEYFSDGLTEEIISDLAAIKSLRVISRTSSMHLKGTTKDVPTISRELGVRYVMEGSVRKAGNALRITAQLIDATTDARIWGAKYGGTLDDVFELQERVAREIVAALGITLTTAEDRHLAQRPIEDARAFELFLQARQEMHRYGLEAIERGEELVRRAMTLVGEAAPLKALLAWGKVARVRAGLAADRSGLDDATAVAEQLLREAPDAPYGHALLGFIGYERGALPGAIGHLRAALDREPNDADALFYLGICLVGCGHAEAGARVVQRLLASDPLSPLAWLLAGLMPWWTGHFAEGVPNMERALALDPSNAIIRWSLGYGRALVGDVAGAAADAAVLQAQAPAMPYTAQLAALVHAIEGRQAEALTVLRGVHGLDSHHKFHLAESFAMAGDTDRAFALLEEAVTTGFHPGDFIARHCPFLEPLRGTPRFDAVAARALRLTREFAASGVAP